MPIELGIWRLNGDRAEKIHFSSPQAERKLENVLYQDISILDDALLVIGRQIATPHGKFIDILAINIEGDLSILELKRDRTPRDVVAQILDYAWWVRTLTYEQIASLYSEHHNGEKFEQAFCERFGTNPPEKLNEDHQLVIVATELDNSTERIVNYLSLGYGVPINAAFFEYFPLGKPPALLGDSRSLTIPG